MKPTKQRVIDVLLPGILGAAFAALVICGTQWITGCAGAPRSVDQLATMDDASFASWKARVGLWTELGAQEALRGHPERRDALGAFAAALRVAAGEPLHGDVLSKLSEGQAAFVRLLALEGEALINARGGIASLGPRGAEVLVEVAGAIERSVAAAK